MKATAIIVAGGQGKRMGAAIPKQLLLLEGKTILERTLLPFLGCEVVQRIVVTASEDIRGSVEELARALGAENRIQVVRGGAERQESVWNGLSALPEVTGVVTVHDAVRPFVTSRLIAECIDSAERYGAVTVARPVTETVKVVENGVVTETLDRTRLRLVQTPQAFRAGLLIRAHTRAREEGFAGTDDCVLVERLGEPVHVIDGSDMNIKITTPADLLLAGAILPLFECGGDAC